MQPGSALEPHVAAAYGYRMTGFEPGVHLGLPSGYLTVVISMAEPTMLAGLPDRGDGTASLPALVGGLHRTAVEIHHDGSQYGVQLAVRPDSARALFGVPAAALTSVVVELDELIPAARHLPERLAAMTSWQERFDLLAQALPAGRDLRRPTESRPAVCYAWQRVVATGGAVRVADLASETGWSRRHLTQRFAAEYGMAPKELARMVRFHRSRELMDEAVAPSLVDVAARSGYADQAHMTREWVAIAGCTPTAWREHEHLPFVQDGPEVAVRS